MMNDNKPPEKKTFKQPLDYDNKTVSFMCGQVAQQRQVLRCVQAVLPSVLAEKILHCLIKESTLLVYTDSAVWATQLRFQHQALLEAIAPLNKPVTQVRIKVIENPTAKILREKPRQTTMPTLEAIDAIRKGGLAMPDDEVSRALLSLSATLERLAKEENQAAGRGD
jgi:hypothetical protein